MSDLPMMPWFPNDFAGSTLGWRFYERALYRCLLDAQWVLGALPNDTDELARIAGITDEEFTSLWKRVSKKFVTLENGSLQNEKLEEHRRKAIDFSEKKRRAGRAGGKASAEARREANDNDCSSTATASVKHPSSSSSSSPSKESPGSDESDHQAGPSIAKPMPKDWKPNAKTIEWLKEAGVTDIEIREAIKEFVLWAHNSERRQKSWELAFQRNPKVMSIRGRALSRKQGGGLNGSAGAWQKVVQHIKEGKRGGVDDGGPIDTAVNAIGGYRAVGQSSEKYLGHLGRQFAEHYQPAG